jgi:hypothetical protein
MYSDKDPLMSLNRDQTEYPDDGPQPIKIGPDALEISEVTSYDPNAPVGKL